MSYRHIVFNWFNAFYAVFHCCCPSCPALGAGNACECYYAITNVGVNIKFAQARISSKGFLHIGGMSVSAPTNIVVNKMLFEVPRRQRRIRSTWWSCLLYKTPTMSIQLEIFSSTIFWSNQSLNTGTLNWLSLSALFPHNMFVITPIGRKTPIIKNSV